ncbi:hypothetical protein GCM10027421_12780 [Microbacterium shaanxiense]
MIVPIIRTISEENTMSTTTDHDATIAEWITAADAHDSTAFLSLFTADAVLDDPSVGEVFEGHEGVGRYFDSYFIGYNTRTRLVRTEPRDGVLHVEVDFTGDFPGGQTGGIFDITFAGDKIEHVRADLI